MTFKPIDLVGKATFNVDFNISNPVVSGKLNGSFYGENAKELGGSGIYSYKSHMTVFGFTAK